MSSSARSSAWSLCAAALLSGTAAAAQPPDVVQSDGSGNTAMGSFSLYDMTSSNYNTAAGYAALYVDQTGANNTAFGAWALFENTASDNTAVGTYALELNGSGSGNTAVGFGALESNSSGGSNTAVGENALTANNGLANVALGQGALQANTTGSSNVALGETALMDATGSDNIAIGEKAGIDLVSGNNNIYVGASGASESGAIRIGGSFQTSTYIAGIYGTHLTGSAVYIDAAGQLGVLASAERFKTAIAPMGSSSERLQRLRPVTFQLKTDPTATRQFGLIAEEVARVYPELVLRAADGTIQGVRYEELAPMLLNEVQHQARALRGQQAKLTAVTQLQRQVAAQAQDLRDLKRQNLALHEVVASLLAKSGAVAAR